MIHEREREGELEGSIQVRDLGVVAAEDAVSDGEAGVGGDHAVVGPRDGHARAAVVLVRIEPRHRPRRLCSERRIANHLELSLESLPTSLRCSPFPSSFRSWYGTIRYDRKRGEEVKPSPIRRRRRGSCSLLVLQEEVRLGRCLGVVTSWSCMGGMGHHLAHGKQDGNSGPLGLVDACSEQAHTSQSELSGMCRWAGLCPKARH